MRRGILRSGFLLLPLVLTWPPGSAQGSPLITHRVNQNSAADNRDWFGRVTGGDRTHWHTVSKTFPARAPGVSEPGTPGELGTWSAQTGSSSGSSLTTATNSLPKPAVQAAPVGPSDQVQLQDLSELANRSMPVSAPSSGSETKVEASTPRSAVIGSRGGDRGITAVDPVPAMKTAGTPGSLASSPSPALSGTTPKDADRTATGVAAAQVLVDQSGTSRTVGSAGSLANPTSIGGAGAASTSVGAVNSAASGSNTSSSPPGGQPTGPPVSASPTTSGSASSGTASIPPGGPSPAAAAAQPVSVNPGPTPQASGSVGNGQAANQASSAGVATAPAIAGATGPGSTAMIPDPPNQVTSTAPAGTTAQTGPMNAGQAGPSVVAPQGATGASTPPQGNPSAILGGSIANGNGSTVAPAPPSRLPSGTLLSLVPGLNGVDNHSSNGTSASTGLATSPLIDLASGGPTFVITTPIPTSPEAIVLDPALNLPAVSRPANVSPNPATPTPIPAFNPLPAAVPEPGSLLVFALVLLATTLKSARLRRSLGISPMSGDVVA